MTAPKQDARAIPSDAEDKSHPPADMALPGGFSGGSLGRNWPISRRIYFLVLLGLIMFGVGFAVHLLQSDLEENARKINQRYLDLIEDSRDLALQTLMLRNLESAFSDDLSAPAGEAFPRTLNKAKAVVAAIAGRHELGPVAARALAVESALKGLEDRFVRLRTLIERIGLDQKEGLRGKLLVSISAVEQELKFWPLDAVKAKLQQARRFELAFRLEADPTELGHFRKAINELEFAIFGSPMPEDEKARFTASVTQYQRALFDYAEAVERRTAEQARFDALMGELNQTADELRQTILKEIEHAVAQQSRTRQRIGWFLYGAGAISILIFVFLSATIARSIYEPVRRIDSTMRRLAEGESDLEIPHMDRGDEIGAMARSIAVFRQTALEAERVRAIERQQAEEIKLLEITQAISSQLELDTLLHHIVDATSDLLGADRSSLFLYDERADELFSKVAQGLEDGSGKTVMREIRIPSTAGLAGQCFSSGEVINIIDAQSDPRFNKEVDRRTGYHTRNILCMPVVTKDGRRIGVLQALNRHEGPFSGKEENRLRAFAAQVAITLENAKMFEDILTMKNYNESILKSLSNGVITLAPDGSVVKVNKAAASIIGIPEDWQGDVDALFPRDGWVVASTRTVGRSGEPDTSMDTEIHRADGRATSVNLTTAPLRGLKDSHLGTMLILEDITGEKRVKATMARYMTKEVMDALMEEEGESVLGGTAQEVSILFSDVRSFTTISETLGPRGTVSMLNDYFTRMVDVLFQHGGVLDKYIGDAIMAVFGAPLRGEKDADNAVAVATDMMKALNWLNRERATRDEEPIYIGIGIASGEVVAGNIGSPKRMDYTVIGDAVNLASRLEGATKAYGTGVLFCANTQAQLTGPHTYREIDLIRVKGKRRPVAVYEGLDHHKGDTFPHLDRFLDLYRHGLGAYRQRQWQEAIGAFQAALDVQAEDAVSRLYIERCQHFAETPPPEDWDGVWVLTSK